MEYKLNKDYFDSVLEATNTKPRTLYNWLLWAARCKFNFPCHERKYAKKFFLLNDYVEDKFDIDEKKTPLRGTIFDEPEISGFTNAWRNLCSNQYDCEENRKIVKDLAEQFREMYNLTKKKVKK
jgi:hypothetical protein